MEYHWLSILPPLLVIIISLVTKNVRWALVTGIVSAAGLAAQGNIGNILSLIVKKLTNEATSSDHVALFCFLIILGGLVELMNHTGGIHAYTRLLKPYLHSKKAVERTSLLLSCGFFIDDYLNNLTTGNVMRPLTDSYRIPRAKLAFLIDSMSAPLCVLVPASSWVAMILGLFQAGNLSDPFSVYISVLPLLFYPIFLVTAAWIIVEKRLSFGAMRRYEQEAEKTGNLFGGAEPLTQHREPNSAKSTIADFIVPLGSFLATMMGMLLYLGDSKLLGGTRDFMEALRTTNPFFALLYASMVSTIISGPFFMIQEKVSLKKLVTLFYTGFLLMKNSLIVLLLAWTFGALLNNELGLGALMGGLLSSSIAVFALPVFFFALALFISATTGSAWGTMTILMPLAIPLTAPESAFFMAQSLAAIIAGAIAGGHMSPITDAMVLASTSAGCYHMDHVQTQMAYALPVVLGSSFAFLCTGLLRENPKLALLSAYGIGLSITMCILLIRAYTARKKRNIAKNSLFP